MNSKSDRSQVDEASIEQELRDSQARLSGIIASAMDAIITVDEHQRIVLFNKAAEHVFAYTASEVMGRPLDMLIPERFRTVHNKHIQQFGETGVTNRSMGKMNIIMGLRKGNHEFPIEASISQIDVADGKLYSVILRDVTERKQAEDAIQARNNEIKSMTQQLWQAARLATMGELAASIAHELNNPLAILSMRIELLAGKLTENMSEQGDLETMQHEIERMSNLVSNLLQFSRSTQRQVSSIDIREEIDRTLELVSNHLLHRRVSVVRDFSPNVPLIQADRQQMRQLFLNLFTNASDAMPDGGILTVRVEPENGHSAVSIQVIDTGGGIDPANIQKVMEPFFTTKPEGKGTGLGLAICRRIVEEHQGSIQVISAGKNQGTAIHIILPGASGAKPNFLLEDEAS